MRATRPRSLQHRGLGWLVWLALLLPTAQSVATWHAYSHTVQGASVHQDDSQAPQADHCSLCLTAAGVTGGAMLAAQPSLPAVPAAFGLPPFAAGDVWLAPATLGYLSRAPPAASV